MFGIFSRDRKDPSDIAKEYAKANDIALDENPTPKESESSTDDKSVESEEIKDDKVSQEEDTTPKDGKQDEDKDDQLTEEEQKIVDTDDSELDDDSKAKKQEIVKRKGDSKAEKRIKDLVTQVKAMEEREKARESEYQIKLAEIEANRKALEEKVSEPSKGDLETILKRKEQERIAQYVNEDRNLPRKERREMSKEEIDEWLVEDYQEANDWLNRRYDRRKEEKHTDVNQTKLQAQAAEIIHKQTLSKIRVEARNPELKSETILKRKNILKAEGKSEAEIQDILCDEIPKYKAIRELMSDQKFASDIAISPDGPELLEKAMLKKLDTKPTVNTELERRIAELEDQLRSKELRGEPIGTSVVSRSTGGNKMRNEEKHNPALEAELAKMAKKGFKMTVKEHQEYTDRRKTIPGANEYERS